MEKKLEYVSKYLADASKLIIGVGVITKVFGAEKFDWSSVSIGLIVATALAIIGFVAQPGRS